MKKKRVTIYEVAKDVGVSLATVSRVINGSNLVKEPTRVKVKEAIQRLGYRPNAIAQGLASSRTTNIALVVPEASFNYTGRIINGILDVAKIYNYSIIMHTVTEGITEVSSIVDKILTSHVDGVIIYSEKLLTADREELNRYSIPVVIIGEELSGEYLCSVYVDIEKACYELINSYLEKGIKDIAILEDRKSTKATTAMNNAAIKAFTKHGLEFNNLIKIPASYRSSYKFLKEYFTKNKHSLIIANRDSQAIACLNAASENKLSVPNDMEIVCIIDTKYNSAVRPTISSFAIPSYDLGAVSMRLMIKMVGEEKIDNRAKKLQYVFVKRESTK